MKRNIENVDKNEKNKSHRNITKNNKNNVDTNDENNAGVVVPVEHNALVGAHGADFANDYKIKEFDNDDDDDHDANEADREKRNKFVMSKNTYSNVFVFKRKTKTSSHSVWYNELMYNFSVGNTSVVYSDSIDNNLDNQLMYLKNVLNINEFSDKLYPDVHKEISIMKPTAPRVVYQMGMHVRGGLMSFYFFDEASVRLVNGKHGVFMKVRWSQISQHNQIMAKLIGMYNSWENDLIKMQEDIIINLPDEENVASRKEFVKMFYSISAAKNKRVFARGIKNSKIPVECDMFTYEQFFSMFELRKEKAEIRPSDEIKMIMGAVIEGFKVSKNEMELETVHNVKIKEHQFSISIKPICFFYVEQTPDE
ncbi:dbp-2 [Lambdina fiscellaria nucleopolyhedrovirus]|uniref:Dbp-2 n=1 Tax=Lambdina fiscellaria nucleopolyhedrovirus TaxID=1642929 RepID=A0A0E3URC9_9ABAC|nr:dbp-2 [Lambdina fiscellaria nucleopolyhedrovirus]AKC91730.1 dbp-2 [Lambdina fiscellaria nucleopolyhedrovirus]